MVGALVSDPLPPSPPSDESDGSIVEHEDVAETAKGRAREWEAEGRRAVAAIDAVLSGPRAEGKSGQMAGRGVNEGEEMKERRKGEERKKEEDGWQRGKEGEEGEDIESRLSEAERAPPGRELELRQRERGEGEKNEEEKDEERDGRARGRRGRKRSKWARWWQRAAKD